MSISVVQRDAHKERTDKQRDALQKPTRDNRQAFKDGSHVKSRVLTTSKAKASVLGFRDEAQDKGESPEWAGVSGMSAG